MPDTVRPFRRPRPFSGSYLETACLLDSAYPGFLNRLLHASDLRRAAIFAALAEVKLSSIEEVAARLRPISPPACHADLDAYAQIARALMIARAREITRAIYGGVPDGLLGLLARLGGDPLPDRGLYRLAHSLFADPQHRARSKLLCQTIGPLRAAKIEVAARLDPALLHPAVFERVADTERVEALHAALALIRAVVPEATDEALRFSLDGLSSTDRQLSVWIGRWLRRMTRLPVAPPIPEDDPDLRLVRGCDMVELGRRFQNCAATRLGYLALGTRAYLEWTGEGGPAVIELRGLSNGGFVVEDIRGIRNAEPGSALLARIQTKLATVGVVSFTGLGQSPKANALKGLLDAYDVEHGEPAPFHFDLLAEAA
jgi:hypothetical protein